jgi:hypothetical protein
MGGGGGPTITYVYVNDDNLKKAVAYCLDEGNCGDAVGDKQNNGYIKDASICGFLDKTAKQLIAHAGCESFNQKNESFTSMMEKLEKQEKEEIDQKENKDVNKQGNKIKKRKLK